MSQCSLNETQITQQYLLATANANYQFSFKQLSTEERKFRSPKCMVLSN